MKRDFSHLPRLHIKLSLVKILSFIAMVFTFFVLPCHLIDQAQSSQGQVAGIATSKLSNTAIEEIKQANSFTIVGALLLIIGGILIIYLVTPEKTTKTRRYIKQ